MHLQVNLPPQMPPECAASLRRIEKEVGLLFLVIFLLCPHPSYAQRTGAALPHSQGSSSAEKGPPPRQAYVGDEVCRSCHQEKAKTYSETAHHLASYWPGEHPISGNFTEGENIFRTANPYLYFQMDATKDGYFQTAVEQVSSSKNISRTERIAIIAGAGRKGQSYMYWKGDELFQLPVTYWKERDSWGNSPGYPDGSPRFDRPIVPRCFECHGSYFEQPPTASPLTDRENVNRFKKSSIVLGIWCEKCHGPGREHVTRNRSKTPPHPGTEAEAIVNPASLSRDRQMDVCALCHSGAATPIQTTLSFLPGDVLDDYVLTPYANEDTPVDVHASQVQLLRKSRCYKSSKTLTCATCHDVHEPQRDAASFSPHCLSCHQPKDCGQYAALGEKIISNCIDCHMPRQETQAIFSNSQGTKFKPLVRNHRIAIYSEAKLP
jgi:hypothetical protein